MVTSACSLLGDAAGEEDVGADEGDDAGNDAGQSGRPASLTPRWSTTTPRGDEAIDMEVL